MDRTCIKILDIIQKYAFLGLVILLISSCSKDEAPVIEKKDAYSFIAIGHAYGNPNSFSLGLHAPLVDAIPYINALDSYKFAVFTGDVVYTSEMMYWDAAISDMESLDFPYHIAPGNHDRGPAFDALFENYYSFVLHDDLFIVLSPTEWNIEGLQYDFLVQQLEEHKDEVDNIFIFCHELIYWSPDNKFGNIKINYEPHYPGQTNYRDEIHLLFTSLENEVVIVSGDLGATQAVDHYMYHKEDNVTFVASGLGGGIEDNVLIVEVDENGMVDFRLLFLNDQFPFIEEALEEFELP